jgi:hypothetical protein
MLDQMVSLAMCGDVLPMKCELAQMRNQGFGTFVNVIRLCLLPVDIRWSCRESNPTLYQAICLLSGSFVPSRSGSVRSLPAVSFSGLDGVKSGRFSEEPALTAVDPRFADTGDGQTDLPGALPGTARVDHAASAASCSACLGRCTWPKPSTRPCKGNGESSMTSSLEMISVGTATSASASVSCSATRHNS